MGFEINLYQLFDAVDQAGDAERMGHRACDLPRDSHGPVVTHELAACRVTPLVSLQ